MDQLGSFTRQNIPNLSQILVSERRNGVLKGGYRPKGGRVGMIILALEVRLHLKRLKNLASVRVVSMPCMERFDRQDAFESHL